MAKRALIIIDMLNDFVQRGAPLEVPETRKVIPSIKRQIEESHKEGSPVIYVCDAHEPDDSEFRQFGWPPHAVRGTSGAEVVNELKPSGKDIVVEKTSYSGFYHTELDKVLKNHGVDTVRLTGCVTHICVLFAALEAGVRGYRIEVVGDGVAGLAPEDHEAALRIMKNVTRAQIV
ncbi:MAG: cysteine hydrolase family protein [bacterium]